MMRDLPTSSPTRIEVDPPHGDGPSSDDVTRDTLAGGSPSSPDGLWFASAALWSRRWLIIGITVFAAVAGVAISLLLPVWYRAETRVMLPESGGGMGMSALIESVAPGAGALLGGGGGDYTRYLAILTSRTVLERAVERFDLMRVYKVADKPAPMERAVAKLRENATFDVSLEYNYLAVHVLDQSPDRAAQLANYFVEELNRENTRLSSESAREQRIFVESRLRETEAALDSVRGSLQALQERYGVSEPVSQGEALMTSLAVATSAVAEAEVRYETLRSQFGDDGNPDVSAAAAALRAARGQLNQLSSGGSALMPVPLRSLPQVGRQYAQLQQEMLIQAKIMEFVRPMYEQTLFDERQTTSAVQVIDEAVPPQRKAKPKRALVVFGVMLSASLLAVLYAIAQAHLRLHAGTLSARLRRAG